MRLIGWVLSLSAVMLAAVQISAAAELPVTGEQQASLAPFDQLMIKFVQEHHVPGRRWR